MPSVSSLLLQAEEKVGIEKVTAARLISKNIKAPEHNQTWVLFVVCAAVSAITIGLIAAIVGPKIPALYTLAAAPVAACLVYFQKV